MNLSDLIKRKDRAVKLIGGRVEPAARLRGGEPRCVVLLDPGTELVLERADEFQCLQGVPRDIGWRAWNPQTQGGRARVQIDLVSVRNPRSRRKLFSANLSAGAALPVAFSWPLGMRFSWRFGPGWKSGYHLSLKNAGPAPAAIDHGLLFNARARLLPLIKGKGVEIGPGLNPHILPAADIDVSYVEALSAEEWVRNYKKTDKPSLAEQHNLWSKYVVADAQQLASIEDGSLDFIYSNHVFEHLLNPLATLANWRRKLKSSGIVIGVVPDCRYVFDLRQPPSAPADWLRERAEGSWTITRAHYEKWCRYTAPYNTPEDLIRRNYSIHVHYYTPDTFAALGRIVVGEGLFGSLDLETSLNHKDFGYVFCATARVN
jgi:SAM-dependent methyltransferase